MLSLALKYFLLVVKFVRMAKIISVLFTALLAAINLFSQEITNIHFEQQGKMINIYYDLSGEGTYEVNVYCSQDGGKNWGNQLIKVSGDVGKEQKAGIGKKVVWDALAEWEKLEGDIIFKIEALPEQKGETFTDVRDGKTYKYVKIGEQVWMAQNLNYGKYIDGNKSQTDNYRIEGKFLELLQKLKSLQGEEQFVTPEDFQIRMTDPKYRKSIYIKAKHSFKEYDIPYNSFESLFEDEFEKYCYDNDEKNCEIYGGLYQWDEMMKYTYKEATQGICPDGWHIPTIAEYLILIEKIGGKTYAGGILKEEGLSHWISPNAGATNTSKFSILPGGYRSINENFVNKGEFAFFWTSSMSNTDEPWTILLGNKYAAVTTKDVMLKECGFSLRCIKN